MGVPARQGCSGTVQRQRAIDHEQFCIFPSGLFLDVQHSYFGASPDGMVDCSCCEPGIREVKVSECDTQFS